MAARDAADLVGVAFAVAGPRVIACSRQAHAAGVRPRMTAAEARALGAKVVERDRAREAAVTAALGDVLLGVSAMIDVAEPGVAYALVPPGERAARFGERMVRAAAAVGLAGRVGIADDRFTAWAATHAGPRPLRVRTVPVGGSAAFLAPLPLSLLPLDDEVRRVLGLFGVRTIGEFAALPPPSVGREDLPGKALARGQDRTPFRAFAPTGPVVETGPPERALFDRIAARLDGRHRVAAKLVVGDGAFETEIVPPRPTRDARLLGELTCARVAGERLVVTVCEADEEGELLLPLVAQVPMQRVRPPNPTPPRVAPLRLVPYEPRRRAVRVGL